MTDRLTPHIYLELYTGPGLPAGHKYVMERGQFTAVPMEEAARREAEAKPHVCQFVDSDTNGGMICHGCGRKLIPKELGRAAPNGSVTLGVPTGEREGPGSAAAPTDPDGIYRRILDDFRKSGEPTEWDKANADALVHGTGVLRDGKHVPLNEWRAEDKPAPAADDLVRELRRAAFDLEQEGDVAGGRLIGNAADRIEALTAREIELREKLAWFTSDPMSAHDWMMKAAQADEKLAKAEARVRELEADVVFWNGQSKAEKARADRLADELNYIASYFLKDHWISERVAKALASKGGDRG